MDGASAHWYAKLGPVKPGRKMGHFTVVGSDALEVATKLRQICGDEPEIDQLFGTGTNPEVWEALSIVNFT